MPLHIVLFGCGQDGIQPETVVDVINGLIKSGNFFILPEEEVHLIAFGELNGMQPDAPDFMAFPQKLVQQRHSGTHTGLLHIVVEVGITRGIEYKGDAFPVGLLKPDVPGKLDGFALVPAHAVAQLTHGFGNFALYRYGIVGPVGKGVHVTDFLWGVEGGVGYPGTVLPGYGFIEHLAEIRSEKICEHALPPLNGIADGLQTAGLQLGVTATANAPDLFERQAEQALTGLLFIENTGQSVGFMQVGGQLGIGLGVRHPYRTEQTGTAIDLVFKPHGHRFGFVTRPAQHERDIQKELVHGIPLHIGSVPLQNGPDVPRNGLILLVVHLHEQDVGTDLCGFKGTHGGFDSEFSGFVAGGRHNATGGAVFLAPAPDNHRHPEQTIGDLLYLGIETVHIQMQVQPRTHTAVLLIGSYGIVQRDAVYVAVKVVSGIHIAHILYIYKCAKFSGHEQRKTGDGTKKKCDRAVPFLRAGWRVDLHLAGRLPILTPLPVMNPPPSMKPIFILLFSAIVLSLSCTRTTDESSAPPASERPEADDIHAVQPSIGQDESEPPEAAESLETFEEEVPGFQPDLSHQTSGQTLIMSGSFSLIGTFTGTLPCADCAGIEHELSLYEHPETGERRYTLQRTWLSTRRGNQTRYDAGPWQEQQYGGMRVFDLSYPHEQERLRFQVQSQRVIRLLDQDGQPIESDLNYALYRLPN